MQISWEAVGAIGEIAGAIVVIATLVYLARQIRQSNRIAFTSTEIDVRNSFASINETIYADTGVAELISKATDPNVEFSVVEKIKISALVRRAYNTWGSVEIAYANEMVSPETYKMVEEDIRNFLTKFPATLPIWRTVIDTYPAMAPTETFRFLNRILEEHEQ